MNICMYISGVSKRAACNAGSGDAIVLACLGQCCHIYISTVLFGQLLVEWPSGEGTGPATMSLMVPLGHCARPSVIKYSPDHKRCKWHFYGLGKVPVMHTSAVPRLE